MFASISDKLSKMLYEEDPAAPKGAVPSASTAGIGVQSMSQPAALPSAGLNTAMVEAIKKVTFGRNTAFTQLLQTSEALADVIPDQVMRLKAAHKTAGAGRTGKQIAEAVDVHLQDVDGEVMRFKAAIEQKSASEVSSLQTQQTMAQQQIERAHAEIKAAQDRIASLSASITELTTTATQLGATIAQKQAELVQAESEFALAAQAVRDELNSSKSAILSTLV